jgi:hypothetical protein
MIVDTQEEMSINKTEWDQIRILMRDALVEHSRTKLNQLKSWSPLGVAVAIALFAITQWNTETIFRTHTGDRLDKIEGDLISMRALVAASQPERSQNQNAAKELIAQARAKVIPPIALSAVAEAGESFIEAAGTNAHAWSVAVVFVQYRSILNESVLSGYHWLKLEKPDRREIEGFHGNQIFVTAETIPCVDGIGEAHIGPPNSNRCSAYMLFVGGEVPALDGNHFKNTIFQKVRISYTGGPLTLENVAFVNCTFNLPRPDPRIMQLASAVLKSTDITIKT